MVIDSDEIVHDLLDGCQTIKDAVFKRFGSTVCNSNGTINRKALAGIVFADSAARKDLESIIHPAVHAATQKKIEQHANESVIACLIPLLFEAGMPELFNEIWSVDCPYDKCVQRLKKRCDLTEEEINQRMQAQMPLKEKNARAHAVIDNSGTIDETRAQVAKLLEKLRGCR
jgi:dephospho-CoA kinase